MEHTKEPVVDLRAICIADENTFMKTLADRIVGNANPEEDSRLDVAYAIARHLKLDWPSAYAAPQPDYKAQRDELLAACLEAEDYYPSEAAPPYMAAIRAAIASTKETQP